MADLYDDVWIYGPPGFWNPMAGVLLPERFEERFSYTGFLRREAPAKGLSAIEELPRDFILVTAGGGGDGAPMMHAVLAAREIGAAAGRPLVFVLGPFMRKEDREEILRRAAALEGVHIIDFHNRPELLLDAAAGVVSMGGYNTFCEIMSLNKRALLIPRVHPRKEQLIRATRASELGLLDMLLPEEAEDPAVMAAHLDQLLTRGTPRAAGAEAMLGGLDRIVELVRSYFPHGSRTEVFLPPAAE
jgi:predicted glycosyltransferase